MTQARMIHMEIICSECHEMVEETACVKCGRTLKPEIPYWCRGDGKHYCGSCKDHHDSIIVVVSDGMVSEVFGIPLGLDVVVQDYDAPKNGIDGNKQDQDGVLYKEVVF